MNTILSASYLKIRELAPIYTPYQALKLAKNAVSSLGMGRLDDCIEIINKMLPCTIREFRPLQTHLHHDDTADDLGCGCIGCLRSDHIMVNGAASYNANIAHYR